MRALKQTKVSTATGPTSAATSCGAAQSSWGVVASARFRDQWKLSFHRYTFGIITRLECVEFHTCCIDLQVLVSQYVTSCV